MIANNNQYIDQEKPFSISFHIKNTSLSKDEIYDETLKILFLRTPTFCFCLWIWERIGIKDCDKERE